MSAPSNTLATTFKFSSLLKFALPTIVMMVFMSLYSMVDGVFVARLVSTNALAAINIIYPFISIVLAAGIMLATGGSAVVARKMGKGNSQEAKENFTFVFCVGITVGLVISLVGLIKINDLPYLLGANEAIYGYCYDYAYALLWFIPLAVMQILFQTFFVAAGRPGLGLGAVALGGCANIVLDYVFIALLGLGITGAAVATGISYCIPALFGLLYFSFNRKSSLCFVRPKWDSKVLLKTCTNGSSEMVTNLALAVITYLFNITTMRYLGENGVAAISIILYAEYLLTAIYFGYSLGIAPIISYKYGNEDTRQLKKIFRISLVFLLTTSLLTYAATILFAKNIVQIFTPQNSEVFAITVRGLYLYSLSFLLVGMNIFASSMFTALSNGKISAGISFMRTFVFIISGILFLPQFMGVDGIWLAVPIAEVLTVIIAVWFFYKKRQVYQYA